MNRKMLLGIAVSALLLWLSLRSVELDKAWAYAQNISLVWVLPSILVIAAEIGARALKWQVLLWPIKRASFTKLNNATLIGVMANNVLPARAGEFVRAYAGARLAGIPYTTSLATVVIDRVLDGLSISAIFILVIIIQPLPDVFNRAGYVAAAIYLVALVFLVGLIVRTDQTISFAARLLAPLPERLRTIAIAALTSFVDGLAVFRNVPLLIAGIAISFVVWVSYAFGFYLMFLMFDLQLNLLHGFVVLLVLTIALTVPAAPGFVGVMEWAIGIALGIYGVNESQAFALAVVYHVLQYIPITIGGLIVLWLEGMSISDMTQAGSSPT